MLTVFLKQNVHLFQLEMPVYLLESFQVIFFGGRGIVEIFLIDQTDDKCHSFKRTKWRKYFPIINCRYIELDWIEMEILFTNQKCFHFGIILCFVSISLVVVIWRQNSCVYLSVVQFLVTILLFFFSFVLFFFPSLSLMILVFLFLLGNKGIGPGYFRPQTK